ncbi:uncharacterized protein LOC127002101 isoform X2 [Eriocheir sinensis]|uniref:uncharacterized protein LOC127002101 isoform X2 n=1 Tax=Eriocheir sinensis TaxID=95602 RepID=UPI0021C770BD|nr:uncharacterized protein LOC127002101 isoform X2 [Eriocheir sinensis]
MTPNTPASLLPILLLLRPSAMPAPGAILNLAAAQNCTADVTIYKADGWKVINKAQEEKDGRKYVTVYVQPEEGFEGVRVKVKVGTGNYEPWVLLEKTCFPDETAKWWWMVRVMVMVMNKNNLIIQLKTGECFAKCVKEVDINNTPEFHIMPHGTSKWRLNKPNDTSCPTREISQRKQPNFNCTDDPPQTSRPHSRPYNTTHNPDTPPAGNPDSVNSPSSPGDTENATPPKATSRDEVVIVAVVVGVVVVVLVVVGVGVGVAVKWNRRRRYSTGGVMMQPSRDTPTSSKEVVVVENSLYEPFENFQRPQPSHE